MPPEQDETQIAAQEAPTLRESLEAGFAAAESPAVGATPEAASDGSSVARDEAGRFAPKPETQVAPAEGATETTQTTAQPEAAATEAPQGEPIPPPATWTAASKAKWEPLDPDIKSEISKRETDMVNGMQKQAQAIKRFERIDEAIAPHRNYLAMNGLTEDTYVRSLVAADELLRGPNPLDALAKIAGMYNIDLSQLANPGQQSQQAQQPQLQAQRDPEFNAMAQKLSAIEQTLAQQQSAAQESAHAQYQTQIDTFAKNNLYFENVKPVMTALLRTPALAQLAETSPAEALKAAYDQACRASPEIYPLLQKEAADKRAAEERAAASAKANEARQAGVSVTGSPTPGAAPVASGPPPSLRESLERGFSAYATQ